MTAPVITEAEWLLAVQANQRDTATAVLAGDTVAAEQLRDDYARLQAWRPGGAR